MNMSWQGFSTAMPKTPLLPSVTLLALSLSGCSMYMGDHKVIVERETGNTLPNGISDSQARDKFPDPVLPYGLTEAAFTKDHANVKESAEPLPKQEVYVCFPRIEKC